MHSTYLLVVAKDLLPQDLLRSLERLDYAVVSVLDAGVNSLLEEVRLRMDYLNYVHTGVGRLNCQNLQ